MSRAAVVSVAGRELRRTWRRLLALGLLAGVGAAAVASGVTVTHRTTSVHDRLLAATHAEDARVLVFGPPVVATRVAQLPGVARSWTGTAFVAQILGEQIFYAGIVAGADRPHDFARPVVVEGRWFDDHDAQQVVVSESIADELGVRAGDTLPIKLLSTAEFGQFDVGFGEPDGAHVGLEVVGIVRAEERTWNSTPIIASAAFGQRHTAISAVGRAVSIRLAAPANTAGFDADLAAFTASLAPMPAGFEEFPHATASYPHQGRAELVAATRTLVGGMATAVAVAGAALLFAAGQAWARLHAAGAGAQQVERALGMTATERTLARLLPAATAALLAGTLGGVGALVGGWLEPLGRARALEPSPGWWADAPVAVAAAVVTVVAMLLLAAATAVRAGRATRPVAVARRSRLLEVLPERTVRPWTVAGLAFVADRGGRERGLSARSAGIGTLVGLVGVVAVATFGASLHTLGTDPERWGWQGDVAVLDATPALVRDLLADPMVADVTTYAQSSVTLGDGDVPAVSVVHHTRGGPGWHLFDGRLPASDAEVAVGAATARHHDLRVGDHVGVTGDDGDRMILRVVGVGLGPAPESAAFSREIALTRATFDALRRTEPFTTAHVTAADGIDRERLLAHLGGRLEVAGPTPPVGVDTLLGLSRLPALLTAFLAVVAAAATVHGAATTARRRRRDLAVLRALGGTAGQARRALRVTSLATTTLAVGVAVPVGFGIGRLVWWLVAYDAGLDAGVTAPWWALLAVPPVALVVAVLAARVTTFGETRVPVGSQLRAGQA